MLKRIAGRGLAGVVLMVAVLAVATVVRAEEIRVAGLDQAGYVTESLKEHFERVSGIQLSPLKIAPSSFQELMKNSLDAVVVSLPLEDVLEDLKKEGVTIDSASIRSVSVGRVPVSVVVTRENPVTTLSKEQLKALYTGKILNWRELGGKNEAIRVIRPWGYPVGSAVRFQIMDGEAYAVEFIKATSWEDSRKAVVETPDSIAILPTALVDSSIKAVTTPEIVQNTILLTRGEPSGKVNTLIEFLKSEGEKYRKK